MRYGRANVIVGALGLLVAGMGGMVLGATFDGNAIKDGYHLLTVVRFYLREGHSHGMPLGLFNLIVGALVDRLTLSDRAKQICSWGAILGFVMPLGLALKGASGASASFPPIGVIGALGIFAAATCLLVGALGSKPDQEALVGSRKR